MPDEFHAVARAEVQPGWDVNNADGDRIGAVDEVGHDGFTVALAAGGTMRIDFSDSESADESHVNLLLSRDELPDR
jgi:hypothetical protein